MRDQESLRGTDIFEKRQQGKRPDDSADSTDNILFVRGWSRCAEDRSEDI
jgi:hypothetical protein